MHHHHLSFYSSSYPLMNQNNIKMPGCNPSYESEDDVKPKIQGTYANVVHTLWSVLYKAGKSRAPRTPSPEHDYK